MQEASPRDVSRSAQEVREGGGGQVQTGPCHEVLTNVPETKCRKEPSEKCWDEPVQKCQQVPEEKCWQVPHQKCWNEPREHCTQKTERVERKVCVHAAKKAKYAAPSSYPKKW